MRLKKLILQGFKSFADRTEFVFDAPITGIVGPNGCGKSNVVDGFKWVLGEQSAKSLRGDAMLDVIFNGSGGRKPAGMAEVVLVFENPQREDGARTLNLDVDEVSVGRRLYRDGASEYQINNAASRLKDIRELFLDTGVGVDAYSLIEQGRVSALLESNPQERRLIFEEAAGISKFKQRKKESQRKLERVDQNLLRVNDIVEEVAKQLRSVKVQAGRARSYQELSQRQSELRLTYALQEYHTQDQQITQLTQQQQDAQFRLDDAAGDLQSQQSAATLKRDELESLVQAKQQAEHQLVQATASLQSARQRQQYARQQLDQMAEQLEQFEQDRAHVESRLAELTQTLAQEEQNLVALTESLEQHRLQIEQRQQAFRDAQIALNDATRELEQHKAAILDLMRKLASINSRLGAIQIEQNNIAAQQKRIGERRGIVESERGALDAQRVDLQGQLDQTLGQMSDRQTQLDQRREQAAHLGKQIAALSEQLGASREHRSGLVSRQKLLTDLEARREGVSEGVKSVLRQRDQKFGFIRGLVADVLRVDVEHAHVIEAALDGRDQLLIADSAQAVVDAGDALGALEGRVSVLAIDAIPASSPHNDYDWNRHVQGIRLAIDLVRFEAEDATVANHLLGRTAIVDTLADAAALHREGPAGFRYVTRAGQVLEADGAVRAGLFSAAMGLLSRRSELESLAQQVAEADGRIEHLAAQVAEGSSAAKTLEAQQNELRTELYRMNSSKVELSSKLAQNADKLASLLRELPVLDRELRALLTNGERLGAESQKLTESQGQLSEDQSRRQQRVNDLVDEQKRLSDSLKELGEQLTSSRVLLGQVQEKQLASRQQVQRQSAAQVELRQQAERLTRSAETVSARRDEVEGELEESAAAERAEVGRRDELTERVTSLKQSVSALSADVQQLTQRVEALRGAHAEAEQTLHGLQLKLSELTVRRETLVQRTLEELQLDLPARYQSIASEGDGYQPGETDWNAVAAEIKELRERIGRLGNVNLDAINELEELEKREQFLAGQVTDLTTSKRQLEELIDTINAESGQRFEQTFNAVREHFQGMFRKLFGGGKADIYLETELDVKPSQQQLGADGLPIAGADKRKVDVLDAGIEIIARPPGKQPVSISQLSGGEKTMTCVALLMSIFKSKPSPFCILDEVDAALDEANNQRFNLIVQEFLSQSQFIVITHSKRTMQMADILYGVTMQEQGVSKRVAVKFDQVDNQGRINEPAAA